MTTQAGDTTIGNPTRTPTGRSVRTVSRLSSTVVPDAADDGGKGGKATPQARARRRTVQRVRPLQSDPEGDARRSIAMRLVWVYAALLFATVLAPAVLYFWAPTPSASTLTAIKDLGGPMTVGVSSVTGVIGFVLGYYFKSEERRSG